MFPDDLQTEEHRGTTSAEVMCCGFTVLSGSSAGIRPSCVNPAVRTATPSNVASASTPSRGGIRTTWKDFFHLVPCTPPPPAPAALGLCCHWQRSAVFPNFQQQQLTISKASSQRICPQFEAWKLWDTGRVISIGGEQRQSYSFLSSHWEDTGHADFMPTYPSAVHHFTQPLTLNFSNYSFIH